MTEFATHFDDDAWLSFICGRLPASDMRAMRAHLDHCCLECQQTHHTWKTYVELASREVPDVPPDSAARFAKAAAALQRSIPFQAGTALLAQRVFDSWRDPLPAGIRGSAAPARQLLYEAGGYLIDVRLEPSRGPASTLIGQVVHAWMEGAGCGAGVALVREDAVVEQTVANSLGEFHFDCEQWDNLKICLGIPDEVFIEVPLPNAGREKSAAGGPTEAGENDSEYWRKDK